MALGKYIDLDIVNVNSASQLHMRMEGVFYTSITPLVRLEGGVKYSGIAAHHRLFGNLVYLYIKPP